MDKKLLVVVDYQVDFAVGSLGNKNVRQLEGGIAARVEEYLNNGGMVVFLCDTHHDDYLKTYEGKKLPVVHTQEGSLGWGIYGKVKDVARERLLVGNAKYRETPKKMFQDQEWSVLGHTQGVNIRLFKKETFGLNWWDYIESSTQYDEIELVGDLTNVCVLYNAVILKTLLPEARVMVNSKLTAALTPEIQEQTLKLMETMFLEVI